MSDVMDKFARLFQRVLAGVGSVCGVLLLVLVVVQFGIVLARYMFGLNFLWLQEIALVLHATIFMLSAAWGLAANKHVRIDIFWDRMAAGQRARVEWIGSLFLLLPMMAVLLVSSWSYVIQSWMIGEGSAELSGLPGVYLVKSLIVLFALLMIGAGITRLVQKVHK